MPYKTQKTLEQLEKEIAGSDGFTLYEDVKDVSTEEYFNGNAFSIKAFKEKYASIDNPNETYPQALKRVCDYIASVEKTEEFRKYWSKRWFHEIYNDWWHPAGSIMQGAGSGRKISLGNCTTTSLGTGRPDEEWDTLEAIIRNTAYTVAKAAAYRQGTGIDFSRLRPKGTSVLNSAKSSTGAIHWMQFIDSLGNYVGQSGRIPALLISLSCSHPDVEEFICLKADRTKVQNANISVQCTEDFYEAVKKDKNWDLTFEIPEVKKGQKVYVDEHSATKDSKKDETGWYYIATHARKAETVKKTVKAKGLMELIAKNMHAHAEPGIQNIDIAKRYSNSDYLKDPNDKYAGSVCSTNACSEQYLTRDGECILSSENCERFSIDPVEYEKEQAIIGPSINRFLDNVNECEIQYCTYATPHQRIGIIQSRRTGAGITNIAGWLFKQDVAYGTEKSAELMERFQERYTYHVYAGSIRLGHEKGSFGMFNQELLEKAPFIKRMMKLGLKFDALRNVTLISIAPTGSLSLMFRNLVMSYGIEPSFGIYYWKRTRMSGPYIYYFNVPHIVRETYKKAGFEIPMESDSIQDDWHGSKGKKIVEFMEAHKNDVGIHFKDAHSVTCVEKLELMARVMKWVDSSISVTYELPEDSTWKDVYNFIMLAHDKEVKSIAAFPSKKMYGIVSMIPFKELADKVLADGISIHPQNFSKEELAILSMFEEDVVLQTKKAPKRPETLDADVYSIIVNKEKFIIAIGLRNKYPYEIFGGKMNGLKLDLESKTASGKITKVARGVYSLEIEETIVRDFSKQFTPIEKVLFRSWSLMLRHGIPIEFIVEQLNKANDSMSNLTAAIARVLNKYIKDGQKVSGRACPSCGGTMIYHDGCCSCACGYQACNQLSIIC